MLTINERNEDEVCIFSFSFVNIRLGRSSRFLFEKIYLSVRESVSTVDTADSTADHMKYG